MTAPAWSVPAWQTQAHYLVWSEVDPRGQADARAGRPTCGV